MSFFKHLNETKVVGKKINMKNMQKSRIYKVKKSAENEKIS